ncbi:metallophosphoesterase [Leucobacter sp. BZR 635]
MATLRILHLTDTHLHGDDSLHYGVVDTESHLRMALQRVADRPFDLVVCSGDISEDGSVASYELVRDILDPWAAERGARTIYAMGNHDDRGGFREVLGEGQPGVPVHTPAAASPLQPPSSDGQPERPVVSVTEVGGWRTIVLDTTVPGAGYGELSEEQLDFLEHAVQSPAGHGTVIVMHHPPVRAETDLLQALALDERSADGLWDRIRDTDVTAILSGHYHHPIVETVYGMPVVVAPGVTNLAAAFDGRTEESANDWFGAAVVEVSAERTRVLPLSEPATGDEVFRFNAEQVGQIIEAAGRQ